MVADATKLTISIIAMPKWLLGFLNLTIKRANVKEIAQIAKV